MKVMKEGRPLILTKLRRPFTRPHLVPRPRLQERMARGLRRPLTLITAPAGFGKTTLAAASLDGCGMPIAWLSVDKDDNEVGRFLRYLVAAVQAADETVGNEAGRLTGATQPPAPEVILTHLINDLESGRKKMVLVLDDYQFISSRGVHEAVAFLLAQCPNALHLVIATRSDPPLPLSRLRARGQMVELRAADLRFTTAEAAHFLNEVMGLQLDAGAIAALEERTEGWIAGLQMAALAMQGLGKKGLAEQGKLPQQDRNDLRRFIETFSGTNRYVLDYLLDEVLSSQPPEIQRFLLRTSILEPLSAPLCDAVLGNDEGANGGGDGHSEAAPGDQSGMMLAYLERANLFLISLDDERIWYRYHHLFADLLRAQLGRSLGAQGVAALHVRAADWHAENGSIVEAIHHASLAADEERVERFIERNYRELVRRGEQSWLRSWTGQLREEAVYKRPWLCIYEAYSHSWFGELDEADRLLEAAEKQMEAEGVAGEARAMRGHLAYVRSRVTAMRGDIEQAIALCLAAREAIPAGNVALESDARITLGYEYFLSGDFANAGRLLEETIRAGKAAGAVINVVAAACVLARMDAVQGRLHQAYDRYEMAGRLIPEAGEEHLGARALVDVGMADVLTEWNELEAALARLERGLKMLRWWGKADDLILAQSTLVRIHLAQENGSGAREAVEKAVRLVQRRGVFSEARRAAEAAQVGLWLAEGNLRAANAWAVSHAADQLSFENERTHFTRARILLAQRKGDEAVCTLSRLEENARSAGRIGRVVESLLLKALALAEMGEGERALAALGECLAVAEPAGYMRIFLDAGRPAERVLTQWLAQSTAGLLRDYADYLLAELEDEGPGDAAGREEASVLVEALSPREMEVLHLLALGQSNKEIAKELIIAAGTVKAHTASIYRKLDVGNRTEAATRARDLGILK